MLVQLPFQRQPVIVRFLQTSGRVFAKCTAIPFTAPRVEDVVALEIRMNTEVKAVTPPQYLIIRIPNKANQSKAVLW